jgi:hypothetical protein
MHDGMSQREANSRTIRINICHALQKLCKALVHHGARVDTTEHYQSTAIPQPKVKTVEGALYNSVGQPNC